ncbi:MULTISPECIES: FAS1-like dehydratase domain-containing protein [Gordonia]|uniref:MaoC family dehydratase N-terminal domain-containing protein n=1 Tax=Gordonia amicalis TaxID=89053 RepID=A0ABU4DDM5_9ACTN|nr:MULTISPECIES: MaoC family dehydratase N-terminal domain-containing protein [Gordonia]ATD72294.1 hypothetical protein CNO18_20540 [Gordonia sp. 1D]MCR8895992.1 MaoC family dehydratase N-terminal domain-containing protein [Gordonia sp. GONU]MCZ4651549.1 MaoC family dehydratase N-terminal domain-containing protein [Gordonia amicalis]MDJ0452582.1 MaoC family dehydratase N-terminal domain-containing protein [Gordonia amicalis]MDV6307844.1 MaoC family dehydratase N-terminal domain-containing prot
MAVRRFPIESGHVQQFARAIGDTAEVYSDATADAGGLDGAVIPPTFLQASAQFDADYQLRPKPGKAWIGSGADPTGAGAPRTGAQNATPRDAASPDAKHTSNVLHAEQRFHFVRPVRVGEILRTSVRTGDTWEKKGRKGGAMVFTESVTDYLDESGEVVATATAVAVSTAPAEKTS